VAARTTTGRWVVWPVTNGIETNGTQRAVWFLGANPHKLKEEFPVVSDRTRQQMLREFIRVELT
jgi:hypothetical protein